MYISDNVSNKFKINMTEDDCEWNKKGSAQEVTEVKPRFKKLFNILRNSNVDIILTRWVKY